MKEVLILRNIPREGPGIMEDVLAEHEIKNIIVDSAGEAHARKSELAGALVIMGGPDSANDRTDNMKGEIALVRKYLEAGIPVLGICLGLQVLVKAAGGEVVQSPVKEVGFRDAAGDYFTEELTDAGKNDMLFRGLPASMKLFQLHGEMVIPGPGTELLATGKHCRNQVIKVGLNSYGFQGHHEVNEEMLGIWLREDNDLKKLDSREVIRDFILIKEEYLKTGKRIFLNFLKASGFID